MPIVRATVSFGCETGLLEDRATNTFHFDLTSTGTELLENVRDLLQDFYTVPADAVSITGYMSQDLSDGTAQLQIYNLDDPLPRVPIFVDDWTFTPSSGDALPSEVALCISFQAVPVAGQAQARRRGRVFIPWITDAQNTAGRPSTNLLTQYTAQAAELLAASDASVGTDWVVWSPTADAAVGVANGWIDNSWDTQRRRGWNPTSRTTF